MNIVVLGCGALGQLAIHALLVSGHHVSAWQRQSKPHLSLQLVTANQKHFHTQIRSNAPETLLQCQLLLVTTKAHEVKNAIGRLIPYLSTDCPIILLHNGLGVVEQLDKIVQPLLLAVTTHAVTKVEAGYVQTAMGHTDLGPLNQAARSQNRLAKYLNEALPTVAWHDNLLPCAMIKFAVNCVINPLAVEYHCKNGDLLQHTTRITLLCRELAAVLTDFGLELTAEQLYQRVIEIIQLTAGNTCSMLQDIQAHRKTEIDFITGHLLRLAAQTGKPAPLNQALYLRVKDNEAS